MERYHWRGFLYTLVYTSIHQYTLVYTGRLQYTLVYTGRNYQYTLVDSSIHQYTLLVYTSRHQYTLVYTSIHQYTLVYRSIHQYTLVDSDKTQKLQRNRIKRTCFLVFYRNSIFLFFYCTLMMCMLQKLDNRNMYDVRRVVSSRDYVQYSILVDTKRQHYQQTLLEDTLHQQTLHQQTLVDTSRH